jgi:hypothetical protein
MKTKNAIGQILTLFAIIFFLNSCTKDDTIAKEENKKITTQGQAETAVWAVLYSVKSVAPMESYHSYSNEKKNSFYSGYATINGIVQKQYGISSAETYKNLSAQFTNFLEGSTDPEITGTATINGTIYYANSSYSGSWNLSASSIKLSGVIEDVVSISATFSSSINWTATITCASGTYHVGSFD